MRCRAYSSGRHGMPRAAAQRRKANAVGQAGDLRDPLPGHHEGGVADAEVLAQGRNDAGAVLPVLGLSAAARPGLAGRAAARARRPFGAASAGSGRARGIAGQFEEGRRKCPKLSSPPPSLGHLSLDIVTVSVFVSDFSGMGCWRNRWGITHVDKFTWGRGEGCFQPLREHRLDGFGRQVVGQIGQGYIGRNRPAS